MKLRLKALRSLRLNYKRRGVWVWLKGRRLVRCSACGGEGQIAMTFGRRPSTLPPEVRGCSDCGESGRQLGQRGYQRILSEPKQVLAEQEQAAAGAAT